MTAVVTGNKQEISSATPHVQLVYTDHKPNLKNSIVRICNRSGHHIVELLRVEFVAFVPDLSNIRSRCPYRAIIYCYRVCQRPFHTANQIQSSHYDVETGEDEATLIQNQNTNQILVGPIIDLAKKQQREFDRRNYRKEVKLSFRIHLTWTVLTDTSVLAPSPLKL